MTKLPVLPETVARSRRHPRVALAATASAVLALAACGTEKADAGSPSKPVGVVDAQRPGTASGSDQRAAFTAMLNKVARSCPPAAPPEGPPNPDGHERDALEEPDAPMDPVEVELNAADWCASALHEERITHALWDLADPAPAKVRKILNDLGYIDERIHGLKRSGPATRFLLDLRANGGRLCLEGSAAGEETLVEKCLAPETGPFTPSEQRTP